MQCKYCFEDIPCLVVKVRYKTKEGRNVETQIYGDDYLLGDKVRGIQYSLFQK